MKRRRITSHCGFTLIEIVISLLAASVLMLATGVFLADNQRAFNNTYSHAHSAATDDDRAVRLVFQKTVRQACSAGGMATVAADGSWLRVQYYSQPGTGSPDRLARFYLSEQNLMLEETDLDTGQSLATQTVCRTVNSVAFALTGSSAQMFLKLNDGALTRTVNASAVMRSP